MLTKTLGILSLAFLFLFMPLHIAKANTADTIGTILEVEGNAKIRINGTEKPATINMPIHTGDVLLTGPASKIYVMLIDSTELTLSENGELSVDDYVYDDTDTTDNHAVYNAAKGAFLYVSGLVAKKAEPDVTVRIPAGSIGIRGTRFWGGELDGQYGVLVGEGAVDVDTGGGKVRVTKGEGTTLKGKGFMPDKVKKWPRAKMDRAVQTIALKNPEKVGERIAVEKTQRQEKLRAQHKELQKQKLETIRKEIETNNPELKDTLTPEELRKLRRIKASNPDAPIIEKIKEIKAKQPMATQIDKEAKPNRLQPFKKIEPINTEKPAVMAPIAPKLPEVKAPLAAQKIEDIKEKKDMIEKKIEAPIKPVIESTTKPVIESVAKPVLQEAEKPAPDLSPAQNLTPAERMKLRVNKLQSGE